MTESWKAEFCRLWMNPYATRDDVHRAFEIKNANLPKMLYRYRRPVHHSIQELENDSVYISEPANQNDLFDSICTISPSELHKALRRASFTQLVKLEAGNLTEEQIQLCAQSEEPSEALLDLLIAGEPPEQAAELTKLRREMEDIAKRNEEFAAAFLRLIPHHHVRICCFMTEYNSTSMWDRYAQMHEGLCIAYDLSVLPLDDTRRMWLYPVVYRETLFDLTPYIIAHIEQGAISPMWPIFASVHKQSEWSNEKEWRLVEPPDAPAPPGKLIQLAKPAAVYLGARMEPDMQRQVEEIAWRRGVPLFKMEVSHEEGRMIAKAKMGGLPSGG